MYQRCLQAMEVGTNQSFRIGRFRSQVSIHSRKGGHFRSIILATCPLPITGHRMDILVTKGSCMDHKEYQSDSSNQDQQEVTLFMEKVPTILILSIQDLLLSLHSIPFTLHSMMMLSSLDTKSIPWNDNWLTSLDSFKESFNPWPMRDMSCRMARIMLVCYFYCIFCFFFCFCFFVFFSSSHHSSYFLFHSTHYPFMYSKLHSKFRDL